MFQQAVSRQLVSDVDVGAYLSGGMDSGAVTALASSHLPYIKSFTCGFDLNSASGVELGYDERGTAEYMSYIFKTEHYEMVLKAGDMERVLPRLAWHLEEPRVGQSYPNFYAAQLASKFVKVVLSGTGGDELFAGYPWRYYRAVVNDDFEHYIDKYYRFWQRLIPQKELDNVLKPVLPKVERVDTRDLFRNVFSQPKSSLTRPEDYINHSLYFEAKTFLHGLLVVEDKLSMAHSLETRVPFLDNDLVDFAMKIPAKFKLGNLTEVIALNENDPGSKTAQYFKKTRDGKLIFRKTMQRHIPEEITGREKQGFSAPDASWFKGESIDYVRQKLYQDSARIYDFLDRDTVQALTNEHLEGKQNRRLLIWSLLSLNIGGTVLEKIFGNENDNWSLAGIYRGHTDLKRNRDLTLRWSSGNFLIVMCGQAFGMVWAIIHPMFLMGLYVFIFSFVFKQKIGHAELPLDCGFTSVRLVCWLGFQEATRAV